MPFADLDPGIAERSSKAGQASTDTVRISLTGERAKSIGHRRHARQEEAIDVKAGRQVSEAFERRHQGLEPRDRDTARRLEKISFAIEVVGLLHLIRFEATRLHHHGNGSARLRSSSNQAT